MLTLSHEDDESIPSLKTLMASGKENRIPTNVEEENLVSSNKLDCGICLTNKIDIMFYKCGHLYCCENCAVKLNGTCPICRIKYDELVKIYLG